MVYTVKTCNGGFPVALQDFDSYEAAEKFIEAAEQEDEQVTALWMKEFPSEQPEYMTIGYAIYDEGDKQLAYFPPRKNVLLKN